MPDITNIIEGMGSVELERLEKLARKLIDRELRLEKVEGKRGTIYLAHGIDMDGKIIGLWGARGMAHDFMFHDGTKLDTVRQVLMNHASGVIEEMIDRNMIHA